jgi:hypothetical protein
MRLVLAIALVMAATAANAQNYCYQSGNVVTCDNGATGYTSGNVTTFSGGNTNRSGNGANDTSLPRSGNGSRDGNSAYTSGNVTTFSNGRSCSQSGSVWICN